MKTTMADIYRIMGKINSEGGKVRVEQAGSGGLNLYVDRISPYDDKTIDKGHEYFLRGTKKDIYEALIKIRFIPQYRPYSVRANRRRGLRRKGSKIPLRTARAMVRAGLPLRRSELRGNPMSYHVGGLSSLGAKGEARRQARIFNQIKKSVEAENVSFGEIATLASLARSHPKLFIGEPRMAEVAGMTEARYRRLRGNSSTKARPIPGKFYRVYWSHPSRGETAPLIFKGEQLLKLSISDLSRYWPLSEGLKMAKVHFGGPFESWDNAFMNN